MNLEIDGPPDIVERIRHADRLRLYLDYDGTLADFAPTPDEILPDPKLIDLLGKLKDHPGYEIGVISGRRLSHIQALIPIPGITLAGTYGIELQEASGTRIDRLDYDTVRPYLEQLKPRWLVLIGGDKRFYLEDKGWSLALHAKNADQAAAKQMIAQARKVVDLEDIPQDIFRKLGGHKFFELAPALANKGRTIEYLITQNPLNDALLVYIGDDDKDEEAFATVLKNSGIPIKVAQDNSESLAQIFLDSPDSVRQFLHSL
jgi:trehalose 6-phosphate phosphatase